MLVVNTWVDSRFFGGGGVRVTHLFSCLRCVVLCSLVVTVFFFVCFCFVFGLCCVCSVLPVFLDCPFLIAPSVFSIVYLAIWQLY